MARDVPRLLVPQVRVIEIGSKDAADCGMGKLCVLLAEAMHQTARKRANFTNPVTDPVDSAMAYLEANVVNQQPIRTVGDGRQLGKGGRAGPVMEFKLVDGSTVARKVILYDPEQINTLLVHGTFHEKMEVALAVLDTLPGYYQQGDNHVQGLAATVHAARQPGPLERWYIVVTLDSEVMDGSWADEIVAMHSPNPLLGAGQKKLRQRMKGQAPWSRLCNLEEQAGFVYDSLKALKQAHELDITHADVKPANTLWKTEVHNGRLHKRAKLADFGGAAIPTGPEGHAYSLTNTPVYISDGRQQRLDTNAIVIKQDDNHDEGVSAVESMTGCSGDDLAIIKTLTSVWNYVCWGKLDLNPQSPTFAMEVRLMKAIQDMQASGPSGIAFCKLLALAGRAIQCETFGDDAASLLRLMEQEVLPAVAHAVAGDGGYVLLTEEQWPLSADIKLRYAMEVQEKLDNNDTLVVEEVLKLYPGMYSALVEQYKVLAQKEQQLQLQLLAQEQQQQVQLQLQLLAQQQQQQQQQVRLQLLAQQQQQQLQLQLLAQQQQQQQQQQQVRLQLLAQQQQQQQQVRLQLLAQQQQQQQQVRLHLLAQQQQQQQQVRLQLLAQQQQQRQLKLQQLAQQQQQRQQVQVPLPLQQHVQHAKQAQVAGNIHLAAWLHANIQQLQQQQKVQVSVPLQQHVQHADRAQVANGMNQAAKRKVNLPQQPQQPQKVQVLLHPQQHANQAQPVADKHQAIGVQRQQHQQHQQPLAQPCQQQHHIARHISAAPAPAPSPAVALAPVLKLSMKPVAVPRAITSPRLVEEQAQVDDLMRPHGALARAISDPLETKEIGDQQSVREQVIPTSNLPIPSDRMLQWAMRPARQAAAVRVVVVAGQSGHAHHGQAPMGNAIRSQEQQKADGGYLLACLTAGVWLPRNQQ